MTAQPNKNGKIRIMAFVQTHLNVEVRSDLMSTDLSTIWIEIIREEQKNVLCSGIYREWTKNQTEELELICSKVKQAATEDKPMIVMGDTNLDSDQWEESEYRCKKLADTWRREIAFAGLIQYELGITYESYYTNIISGELSD